MHYLAKTKNYIVVLLALVVASAIGLTWLASPVGGGAEPVIVSVPQGSSAAAVAGRLKEKGIIRSSRAFLLAANLSGKSSSLRPGAYRLNRQMGLTEIIDKIEQGDIAAVWVTIPEGFTLRQIAARLAEKELVTEEPFLRAATDGGKYPEIQVGSDGSLEGFLFPDTYLIPLQTDAELVIREMLRTFRQKISTPYAREIETCELSRLVPEMSKLRSVVIVASLIEREAKVPEDRAMISGVIHNRLRIGMRLEIDATVQYARGEHKSRLLYSDLKMNSPYNTYLHAGLPPGPIGNPGKAAIEAALRPAKTDALYYVAREDGTHVFSGSLEEHNEAKKRIRSGN